MAIPYASTPASFLIDENHLLTLTDFKGRTGINKGRSFYILLHTYSINGWVRPELVNPGQLANGNCAANPVICRAKKRVPCQGRLVAVDYPLLGQ
jgi:hypothetical protein